MGVPTSRVGYTIATTRRETTKVHENIRLKPAKRTALKTSRTKSPTHKELRTR
jgi:hypothetical protein